MERGHRKDGQPFGGLLKRKKQRNGVMNVKEYGGKKEFFKHDKCTENRLITEMKSGGRCERMGSRT